MYIYIYRYISMHIYIYTHTCYMSGLRGAGCCIISISCLRCSSSSACAGSINNNNDKTNGTIMISISSTRIKE